MLTIAAVLFAIAAFAGLAMVLIRAYRKLPPILMVFAHGVFAAGGLLALLLALGNGPGFSGIGGISFLIFLIAAVMGFYLLSQHATRDNLPLSLMLVHGGAALTGLLCLLTAIFSAPAH